MAMICCFVFLFLGIQFKFLSLKTSLSVSGLVASTQFGSLHAAPDCLAILSLKYGMHSRYGEPSILN